MVLGRSTSKSSVTYLAYVASHPNDWAYQMASQLVLALVT